MTSSQGLRDTVKQDVVILVPKRDEMRGVRTAFNLPEDPTLPPLGKRRVWGTSEGAYQCAIVEINAQTNVDAALAASDAILIYEPRIMLLVGTACGRRDMIDYFDVVLAERVMDLQETEDDEREGTLQRPRIYETHQFVRDDFDEALQTEELVTRQTWKAILESGFSESVHKIPPGADSKQPKVVMGTLLSSNRLVRSPNTQAALWSMDGRSRAIDMEAAGVAATCETAQSPIYWAAIRAVSDFGTRESKFDAARVAAALASGLTARRLLQHGLPACDRGGKIEEARLARLPEVFPLASGLQDMAIPRLDARFGVQLDRSLFARRPRFDDVVSILESKGVDPDDARAELGAIREKFFTEKYLPYEWENDARSRVRDWYLDVQEVLGFTEVQLESSDVVCVGPATGLELHSILSDTKSLVAVDVSGRMLTALRSRFPGTRTVTAAAESMSAIATDSMDLYVALRVFQSALFDIDAALREARRCLRAGGHMLVSVPDAYIVDAIDGGTSGPRILRGLSVPGGYVDPDRPLGLATTVSRAMNRLGFESVGILRKRADIYVWGTSPS